MPKDITKIISLIIDFKKRNSWNSKMSYPISEFIHLKICQIADESIFSRNFYREFVPFL